MNEVVKIGFENIERIQFDKLEKDFSFIVNDQIYKTNSIVAAILSPRISKLLDENMKISYYKINPKYDGDFNRIIEYGNMKTLSIKEDENQYFENVMRELGNTNELFRFNKFFQEDIAYENVIERIQKKREHNINFDEEISFISSNFCDFHAKYPEAIFALDIDIVEQIISNEKLRLSDEEELYDIILQLYIKSNKYSPLFAYVIFINLSSESIVKFKEIFDINDINKSIWENICCRLEQDISKESKETYKNSHQEFLNNRYYHKRYEHIIQHLRDECQGNVHTQNIITITSSQVRGDNRRAENTVEQDDNKILATHNIANSWIQFDFKERKVLLDSYTLKTINGNENSEHLKSWILEVSNDGKNYTEIDRHENCDLLRGPLKTQTFKVSYTTPQRFIRLTQTDLNWHGDNDLRINQIEFSGILYEQFFSSKHSLLS